MAVCALVAALTACGGPPTQQWTDQEVIKTFKDQIQTTLELDPKRSDDEASVLTDPSNTAGYYTVWVFKSGYSPINYDIDDVPVPPHGVLTWGKWEALDPSPFPATVYEPSCARTAMSCSAMTLIKRRAAHLDRNSPKGSSGSTRRYRLWMGSREEP